MAKDLKAKDVQRVYEGWTDSHLPWGSRITSVVVCDFLNNFF